MRITSQGQVTLPQEIRELSGLMSHTDVRFVVENGPVLIEKETSECPRTSDNLQPVACGFQYHPVNRIGLKRHIVSGNPVSITEEEKEAAGARATKKESGLPGLPGVDVYSSS